MNTASVELEIELPDPRSCDRCGIAVPSVRPVFVEELGEVVDLCPRHQDLEVAA